MASGTSLDPPPRRAWPTLVAVQRRSSSLALRARHAGQLHCKWSQDSPNTNLNRGGGATARSRWGHGLFLQPGPRVLRKACDCGSSATYPAQESSANRVPGLADPTCGSNMPESTVAGQLGGEGDQCGVATEARAVPGTGRRRARLACHPRLCRYRVVQRFVGEVVSATHSGSGAADIGPINLWPRC